MEKWSGYVRFTVWVSVIHNVWQNVCVKRSDHQQEATVIYCNEGIGST